MYTDIYVFTDVNAISKGKWRFVKMFGLVILDMLICSVVTVNLLNNFYSFGKARLFCQIWVLNRMDQYYWEIFQHEKNQ